MPSVEYFAGHFDGEGCLRMQGQNNGWRLVAVANISFLPTLECYQSTFGGAIAQRASQSTHKMMWMWRLHNQPKLLAFLEAIAPYVQEKKTQVDLGIEWLLARRHFPKAHVPAAFIAYGAQCAKQLSALKHFSFDERPTNHTVSAPNLIAPVQGQLALSW